MRDPTCKIKQERADNTAQVVEHLPMKGKALSSEKVAHKFKTTISGDFLSSMTSAFFPPIFKSSGGKATCSVEWLSPHLGWKQEKQLPAQPTCSRCRWKQIWGC
jgi:hypothetical protein